MGDRSLSAAFAAHLSSLPLGAERVLVAASGGADSIALMHLLAHSPAVRRSQLVVGHVDHGIASDSAGAAAMVEELAARLGVPSVVRRLALHPQASETTAREARYDALHDLRVEAGCRYIVLAHHADDQAETVLMRVLHGSGPDGLAGMRAVAGQLVRPLLPFRRQELAHYVRVQRLSHWEDGANADLRHERAWIRHAVMPLLQERHPDLVPRLVRSGEAAGLASDAWRAVVSQSPQLDLRLEHRGISVAGAGLAAYDSGQALVVLRAVARSAGIAVGFRAARRVLALVHEARSGAQTPLGGDWIGEYAFGRLHLLPSARDDESGTACRVTTDDAVWRWGGWRFDLQRAALPVQQPREGPRAWLPGGEYILRAAGAGDRMRPLGGVGHRPVVRLLQEAGVPASRRRGWPVVVQQDEIVWLPTICRADSGLAHSSSEAYRIDAAHR